MLTFSHVYGCRDGSLVRHSDFAVLPRTCACTFENCLYLQHLGPSFDSIGEIQCGNTVSWSDFKEYMDQKTTTHTVQVWLCEEEKDEDAFLRVEVAFTLGTNLGALPDRWAAEVWREQDKLMGREPLPWSFYFGLDYLYPLSTHWGSIIERDVEIFSFNFTRMCSQSPTPHDDVTWRWRRVQRWMRVMIRKQRAVALAMGLHVRLGHRSALQMLTDDVLRLCLK
jgi:hypothetical protein